MSSHSTATSTVGATGRRRPLVTVGPLAVVVAGLAGVLVVLAVVGPRRPGGGPPGRPGSRSSDAGAATVVRVIDGDTLVVDLGGHEERVRLIGIDTPESVALDRPDECYGAEAADHLAALVPAGSPVRLERDVEPRDRYDRLLAYLYRAGDRLFVNAALVEDGYAEADDYPPNSARRAQLDRAEQAARARRAGLWGACGGPDVTLARLRHERSPTHRWPHATARPSRGAPRVASAAMVTLAERLGRTPDDRLVIVNCDGLGSSHAANVGTYDAVRDGVATSASLMVPCPWAREAAARYRGEDVGVQLTLNAEHELYRWGPITQAPSLLGGDGGFPRTVRDLWDHADLDEVRRELRAQIERAILWGFDASHLDSHMGALHLKPEFFDVYLDLAVDFGLPLRLPDATAERGIGFPFRELASEEGVVFPDHVVALRGAAGGQEVERVIGGLPPGITELYLRPAADTPELRALTPEWSSYVDDHALLTGERLRTLLARAGARLVGYRELRDLQRKGS